MKKNMQYIILTRCETLALVDFVERRGGLQPVMSAEKADAIRWNNNHIASMIANGMGHTFIVRAVDAKGEGV